MPEPASEYEIVADDLRVEVAVIDEVAVVVVVAGEVDMATVGLLDKGLREAELLVSPPQAMVIDLRSVRYLGSSGLAQLVATHRRCGQHKVPLRIVATQRAVLRPLQVTGLTDKLPIVSTIPSEWAGRLRAAPTPGAIIDRAEAL